MNAVDTNILIYVHDPRDPIKQEKELMKQFHLSFWDAMIAAACLKQELVISTQRISTILPGLLD